MHLALATQGVDGALAARVASAVDTALKLAKGEAVEQKIWVPFELVTPANMTEYLKKN